jgi:hypothetical protein
VSSHADESTRGLSVSLHADESTLGLGVSLHADESTLGRVHTQTSSHADESTRSAVLKVNTAALPLTPFSIKNTGGESA